MSVGVMKDYKLKLRNLSDSHTLGWSCHLKIETRLIDEKFVNAMFAYVTER